MDLENDLKKWIKTYSVAYCKEAAKRITEKAGEAIASFYNSYTPKYYNPRTDDLLTKSYSSYYHNNGKIIYGGVRISSDDMQPYKGAGITQHEIAYSAWQRGIHGFINKDPKQKIYTYPPIAMIRHLMGEREFLSNLNDYATKITKKEKFTSFILR